jgi:threonine-phosphate decarboxylase
MIEGHGDDGWKYATALRADFSSNVFYGELDAGLREYLRGVIDTVTHYPEAGAASLQEFAATHFGVQREAVLVTNGATEAIYLIARAYRGKRVTIVGPTFAEYADACILEGAEVRWVPWEELDGGGIVFVCNPNNPTGRALAAEELLRVVDRWPATTFVIDESYLEFTRAASGIVTAGRPNVLVLRSLTKSCRIPGLRLGFLTGAAELVARVAAHRMPWSVNRLALEAGSYIFRNPAGFVVPVTALLAATTEWRRELAEATSWRVGETDTHYFLMETPPAFTAAQLKGHLVSRYGLLIRDAANFRGLSPHHFRVACQAREQNRLLTEALQECSRTGL